VAADHRHDPVHHHGQRERRDRVRGDRSQAALSRSYMNRKNQCGAVTAATLRLADARLPAGVTLVVFPGCLTGRWQAQNETPGGEQ
jgi:hypothetical protein